MQGEDIAAQLRIFASSRVKGKVKINVIVFDGFMTGYFENVFFSLCRGAFGCNSSPTSVRLYSGGNILPPLANCARLSSTVCAARLYDTHCKDDC